MYDTLELREVKRIPPLLANFFLVFLPNWHKSRKLGLLCVFDQPKTRLVHKHKISHNSLIGLRLQTAMHQLLVLSDILPPRPARPAPRPTT